MASTEDRQRELLASLVVPEQSRQDLEAWLQEAGPMPDAQALSCFARALNDAAEAFARREATRAGHLPVFEALREWLLVDPSPERLAQLAERLDLSEAALKLSLQRLRQRVRQRIDSNLSLWAPDAERRQTLRQRLRAALTGEKGQP